MQEYKRCQQCGAPVQYINHELVCVKCGLVQYQTINMVHRLPMGVTYQPTNMLVFGKGLGNTLDRNGLLRVLAKGQNGTTDLGLRARFIKILTQTVEPAPLRKALEIASQKLTCLKFGENHLVSNDVGCILRKLMGFCLVAKLKISPREAADACIYYVLSKKHGFSPVPPPIFEKGYVKTRVLKFRLQCLKLCELIDEQTHLKD